MPRSTKTEMYQRYTAILDFAEEQKPVTVRQIYYNLASKSIVPKTQNGYQKVARACKFLRRNGHMDWAWIVDNTRWMRKDKTYNSIQEALLNTARTYRRNLWNTQGCRCEVWCEKDALAGIFSDITYKWDVPLMVSRGFSSDTFLYEAAMTHKNATKERPSYIFLFTDYDAAGETIFEKIKEGFWDFVPDACIYIYRCGLSEKQIVDYNLTTRPPKGKDRKAGYEFCCDLDAVPPNELRAWCEHWITSIVDTGEVKRLENIEKLEQESFITYAENFCDTNIIKTA